MLRRHARSGLGHGSARAARPRRRCRHRGGCTSTARSRSPRGSSGSSSTAVTSSSPMSARIAASSMVGRIVAAVAGVRGEADQALCLQRGERLVDVGQDGRAERLDHGGPQCVLGRASPVARSGRPCTPRSTPGTYRDRSMAVFDFDDRVASRGPDGSRWQGDLPAAPTRPATARRHPRARSEPGAVRAALHPDARRPRRRRDQDRAAGGRPDPVRLAAPQRAVELLRAAERRQAQHQPRPVVEPPAPRSSSTSPSTPTCSSRTIARA